MGCSLTPCSLNMKNFAYFKSSRDSTVTGFELKGRRVGNPIAPKGLMGV